MKKSFSLIEVLVAAALVAIVLIPINASFSRIAYSEKISKDKELAINYYLEISSLLKSFEEDGLVASDVLVRLKSLYPKLNISLHGEEERSLFKLIYNKDEGIEIPYLYKELKNL